MQMFKILWKRRADELGGSVVIFLIVYIFGLALSYLANVADDEATVSIALATIIAFFLTMFFHALIGVGMVTQEFQISISMSNTRKRFITGTILFELVGIAFIYLLTIVGLLVERLFLAVNAPNLPFSYFGLEQTEWLGFLSLIVVTTFGVLTLIIFGAAMFMRFGNKFFLAIIVLGMLPGLLNRLKDANIINTDTNSFRGIEPAMMLIILAIELILFIIGIFLMRRQRVNI